MNIKVSKIMKRFELKLLNKDNAEIEREIAVRSLNRLGIELTTEKPYLEDNRFLITWGTKESNYLTEVKEADRKSKYELLLNNDTPGVILSAKFDESLVKQLVEVASAKKVPVFRTNIHISEINGTIGAYILENLADKTQVHSSLVRLNGLGVLIIGKSGVGKSEAVLELIQKGHQFVADDAVIVRRIGNTFKGEAAKEIVDLLEARGIGIMNIRHVYGSRVMINESKIDVVVELIDDDKKEFNRLPENTLTYELLGGFIPKYEIPIKAGRSTATLIESAANVFIERKKA